MAKNSCYQHLRGCGIAAIPYFLLACAPIVDGDLVARKIQQEFAQKTSIPIALVDCPQGEESKAGHQFPCTIHAEDKRQLEVQVTLKDNPAEFTWSVQTGLIDLVVIEEKIEETFKTQRLSLVTADCDSQFKNAKFKIVQPGETFECQVQEGNEEQGKVMVKVTDQEGRVNFQVVDNPGLKEPDQQQQRIGK